MRFPWQPDFPDVFVHSPWAEPAGLRGHARYTEAKERRDIAAADAISRHFTDPDYLDDIFSLCFHAGAVPLVIAPSSDPEASTNALAETFAGYIAKELELEVSGSVVQQGSTGRDRTTDSWFRLTHEPVFAGEVEKRPYIIADDVFTFGGTLAALYGFILNKGGSVICMTTLASSSKGRSRISLADQTLMRLNAAFDGELSKLVKRELNYDCNCLTEKEAQFILRECKAAEDFEDGITRGRSA